MPAHAERIDFAPPPQPGSARAFGLAVFAHALLLIALTWGVHWKNSTPDVAVEAELWSSVVQQAAPRPVETPPPPPPPTAREPETTPPPQKREADIAVERERKQRQERERREEERAQEKKRQAEKDAREKKAATEKAALDKKRQDEARKREEQQEKAAEAKRREDNIRRMQSMAGATGAADATGNAQRSAGPTAGYADRLAALFKRNISFDPASVNGNPRAVVEVRVSPAGLIIGSRITKSSGVPAWDDAVLRAVEKTERIPSDQGRFYPVFPVDFGPKD